MREQISFGHARRRSSTGWAVPISGLRIEAQDRSSAGADQVVPYKIFQRPAKLVSRVEQWINPSVSRLSARYSPFSRASLHAERESNVIDHKYPSSINAVAYELLRYFINHCVSIMVHCVPVFPVKDLEFGKGLPMYRQRAPTWPITI